VECTSGQSHISDVGADDLDGVPGEASAQFVSPLWMQLEGEHRRARANEWIGKCASAGPEIEHEVASANPRVINQALRPMVMKLVPSPACVFPGHGGPS
jgi:hypothetical protein